MMTNQEDKEFLLPPTGPRTRGKDGRRSIPSLLLGKDEAISSLGKRPLFSLRPQTRRGPAASSSVAQLESSPSSSSNTSAVVSDEEYGAVGGASPAKRAKRATKNIVSPALAATLDRTKLTDVPRHTC
ncbi:hypothetical protein GWK47_043976 [Chionoecetes opilio]|uniref:Uncharacterized protein n=1 Tax=Chionoecetes opilio TaxID=41210 RepID=A0A8J4YJR7_CHIOP|nr:hypothetical protein GWK47_043976 [Chionoecetes opilio]